MINESFCKMAFKYVWKDQKVNSRISESAELICRFPNQEGPIRTRGKVTHMMIPQWAVWAATSPPSTQRRQEARFSRVATSLLLSDVN